MTNYLSEEGNFFWTCGDCGERESVRGSFMAVGPSHLCRASDELEGYARGLNPGEEPELTGDPTESRA